MRQLDPVFVPMMNTTTWFLDSGRVRVMQPLSGRDVILPRRFLPVWEGIEQGLNVETLIAQATGSAEALTADEVVGILRGLESLNLIKLTHPCWVETPEE